MSMVKKSMSSQKEKDPFCGMLVDPRTATKIVVAGKTYYLCQMCAADLKKSLAK